MSANFAQEADLGFPDDSGFLDFVAKFGGLKKFLRLCKILKARENRDALGIVPIVEHLPGLFPGERPEFFRLVEGSFPLGEVGNFVGNEGVGHELRVFRDASFWQGVSVESRDSIITIAIITSEKRERDSQFCESHLRTFQELQSGVLEVHTWMVC